MNINATLIFQAVHFGIVYCALRILVLKPAYALIVDERKVKASIDAAIQDQQEQAALLQEKRYQLWHGSHRFFIHEISQVVPERPVLTYTIALPSPPSQQELLHDVSATQDLLVGYLKECK